MLVRIWLNVKAPVAVISDHPGECPKCGMTLVKQKMTAEQEKMMKEGTYVEPKK
ncbi:MAG: hypothetical protein M3004_05665 [Bacteroidota bacterium]|nr:hypothetical protein [Bacteroidota bacterium]